LQKFPHNVTNYDGSASNEVIFSRGVYSSVDIEEGTAIVFVPARHILHGSQFNRSKIWLSIAALNLTAIIHSRFVHLALGEKSCLFLLEHRCRFTPHPVVAYELSSSRSFWLSYLYASNPLSHIPVSVCIPISRFIFPLLSFFPITSHT
jgi:hypothetical protein